MRLALNDAQVNASAISYINMHGTSTKQGDIAESKAIENVFGELTKNLHCSSTKSMTGHMLGAAGAFEAIACIKSLETSLICPTINLDNQDPECRLNYTPNKAVEKKLNYVLNNSFGFGGTNVSLVFSAENF
jgi:3-oxoacyl-[acyl-carrier-protein] synthase II